MKSEKAWHILPHVWWHTPVNLALRRIRQEVQKFEAIWATQKCTDAKTKQIKTPTVQKKTCYSNTCMKAMSFAVVVMWPSAAHGLS
jgi:hypothetical protein